jgi:hypothetical protein
MKKLIGLFSVITLLVTAGCVVGPPAPAGVSVGVYGEYPYTYYGYGGSYHHYYRPYYYHHYPNRWYGRGYYRY